MADEQIPAVAARVNPSSPPIRRYYFRALVFAFSALAFVALASICQTYRNVELQGVAVGQSRHVYAIVFEPDRRLQRIVRLSPSLSDPRTVWRGRDQHTSHFGNGPMETMRRHVKEYLTVDHDNATWTPTTAWSVARISARDPETRLWNRYRVSFFSRNVVALLLAIVCIGVPIWTERFLSRYVGTVSWRQTAVDVAVVMLFLTSLCWYDICLLRQDMGHIDSAFRGESSLQSLLSIWICASVPVAFALMLSANESWVRWIAFLVSCAAVPLAPVVITGILFRRSGYRMGGLSAAGESATSRVEFTKQRRRWQLSITDALVLTTATALFVAIGIYTLAGICLAIPAVMLILFSALPTSRLMPNRFLLLVSSLLVTVSVVAAREGIFVAVLSVAVIPMLISAVSLSNSRLGKKKSRTTANAPLFGQPTALKDTGTVVGLLDKRP